MEVHWIHIFLTYQKLLALNYDGYWGTRRGAWDLNDEMEKVGFAFAKSDV